MSAQVEVKLAGASSANRTRVVLSNRAGSGVSKPGVVLDATDAIVSQTKLEWVGEDKLLILLCEPSKYTVQSKVQRNPMFRPDGSDNSVHVEIINTVYSAKDRTCHARP
jgi:hypothetical protein